MADYYTLYLYYLRFTRTNSRPSSITAHYYFNPDPANPITQAFIEQTAREIYSSGAAHPTCYGTSFDDLVRRRKSYFAVVVELDDDSEINGQVSLKLDYVFIPQVSHRDAAHTFKRPRHFAVNVGTKTIKGVYYENLIERATGIGHFGLAEDHWYHLKFTRKDLRLFDETENNFNDSGGTNMGPPVPPPAHLPPFPGGQGLERQKDGD